MLFRRNGFFLVPLKSVLGTLNRNVCQNFNLCLINVKEVSNVGQHMTCVLVISNGFLFMIMT